MKFSKTFNVHDEMGNNRQVVFQKITDVNHSRNIMTLSIFTLVERDEVPSPLISIERFDSLESWESKFNSLSKKDAKLLIQ